MNPLQTPDEAPWTEVELALRESLLAAEEAPPAGMEAQIFKALAKDPNVGSTNWMKFGFWSAAVATGLSAWWWVAQPEEADALDADMAIEQIEVVDAEEVSRATPVFQEDMEVAPTTTTEDSDVTGLGESSAVEIDSPQEIRSLQARPVDTNSERELVEGDRTKQSETRPANLEVKH